MDVVALAQAGIEYAVATLGTATTPLHVQKLLRQTEEIVFSFDGDAAGRKAAWRALENSLSQLTDGKQVKFLFLPEGEDPDTYVRKHGKAGFEQLLARAVPLSRFLLEELASRGDLATAEGRARCVHEAKPLLKQMQAGALRLQLVRELAEKTRLSTEEVTQLCELASAPVRPRGAPAAYPRTAPTPLARQLLRVLVANPGLAGRVSAEQRACLDAPELGSVVELLDALKDSGAATSAMVFEVTRESQYAGLYQEVAGEALSVTDDEESARADFHGALNRIEEQRIRKEWERLSANGPRDEAERQRIRELQRRMVELKGSGVNPLRPGA